jgi:hypothetical protein
MGTVGLKLTVQRYIPATRLERPLRRRSTCLHCRYNLLPVLLHIRRLSRKCNISQFRILHPCVEDDPPRLTPLHPPLTLLQLLGPEERSRLPRSDRQRPTHLRCWTKRRCLRTNYPTDFLALSSFLCYTILVMHFSSGKGDPPVWTKAALTRNWPRSWRRTCSHHRHLSRSFLRGHQGNCWEDNHRAYHGA